ncbi:protein sym-1 [Amaranthus tricolor]|uniref:protein sym-1 n=1 Tax=Amaranthus tricolor TaxID=29722 RepID=UPI00258C70C0|nr:protein sym-1 [Amaranthus tricolor]
MAFPILRRQTLGNFRHCFTSTKPSPNHLHQFCNNYKHLASQHHHQQQYNVRYCSRFSKYFRKSGKEFEIPAPPYLYISSVSTKSSVLSRIGLFGWYLGMIKSRPVLTKSVTSSFIYIAADLTSQTIALPSSEPYDLIRTLRMAGYGGLILGPTLHYWFNFMSKILPGRDLLTTVKKMALGQSVYGPIMTVVFFSTNAALQGEDAGEIIARLKRDLLPTMLNGVMYWPICDFITFKFVPVHLQPLVSNSFSYVWTVYMTYMASRDKASVA